MDNTIYIPNQNAYIYPNGKVVTAYEFEQMKDEQIIKTLRLNRTNHLQRALREGDFIKL